MDGNSSTNFVIPLKDFDLKTSTDLESGYQQSSDAMSKLSSHDEFHGQNNKSTMSFN